MDEGASIPRFFSILIENAIKNEKAIYGEDHAMLITPVKSE